MAIAAAPQLSPAQTGGGYDLTWNTIDGGGAMSSTSSDGQFELSGTIGQPDAGPGSGGMSGGEYELIGGFWYSPAPGACAVQTTDPPNCAIDARQPSLPNGSNPAGWDSISFTFNVDCNLTGIAPSSFSVRQEPAGLPIAVANVQPVGDVVTVRLSRAISLQTWTCVKYNATGEEVCLGYLPADVNADRTAGPVDILAVINNLNGQVQPPYPIWQCDSDRSGLCAPADILRVIDLLNGADTYDPWLGRTLPVCPTAP